MQPTQREWVLVSIALLVLFLAVGGTHVLDAREANANRAEAVLALAAAREAGAERTIELEGRIAECELARGHGRCPHTGTTVDDTHVMTITGAAPVAVGDACRVELMFSDDPFEGCRALVRCADRWIYGGPGTGSFDCTVDARGLVHGEDENPSSAEGGDPRLLVDREMRTLVISDDAPAWSITLAGNDP
jgi:hypothetical protein